MFINKDYLNNKPITFSNVFENSKKEIFKIPDFKLNNNSKFICQNYQFYPKILPNNSICIITPNQSSMKCSNYGILKY